MKRIEQFMAFLLAVAMMIGNAVTASAEEMDIYDSISSGYADGYWVGPNYPPEGEWFTYSDDGIILVAMYCFHVFKSEKEKSDYLESHIDEVVFVSVCGWWDGESSFLYDFRYYTPQLSAIPSINGGSEDELRARGIAVPAIPEGCYNPMASAEPEPEPEDPTASVSGSEPTSTPEPEKPKADKSRLQALYQQIQDATGGRRGEYTVASWDNLVSVSKNVVNVLEDDNAAQSAVDSAYNSLSAAWNSMKKLDRTTLKKVIDALSYKHKHQGSFSDESWDRYQRAMAAAQAAYEKKATTQQELDKAKNDLTSAESNLQPVDRSKLTALCALAEFSLKSAGETNVAVPPQYTTQSMKALRAVLTPAIALAADLENHSQKKVDDMWEQLAVSYFSLQLNKDAKYNWQDKEFLQKMLDAMQQGKETGRAMAGTPDPEVAKMADKIKKIYPNLGPICDTLKVGSANPVYDPMGVDERTYDIAQTLSNYLNFPSAAEEILQTLRIMEFKSTDAVREQLAEQAGITDPDQLRKISHGHGNYNIPSNNG